MNKKLKSTLLVAAVVAAGFGGYKAYDYSEIQKQSLLADNIEALSSGADMETLMMNPRIWQLVLKYGKIVIDLIAAGMTIEEVWEYFNPPTHLDWEPTGSTRPYTYVDKNGNKISTTQTQLKCKEVNGSGDDICTLGQYKWV